MAEHQWQASQHCGRRRHHDGTKAKQARLANRIDRRNAAVALRCDREVDEYDAILLHNADEKNDADDPDDGKVEPAELEREQRSDAGRQQGRQNRQRMDEALIQHAENDVDDDQRRRDEQRLAGKRRLERLRIALETADHRGGHFDLARRRLDRVHRFAK